MITTAYSPDDFGLLLRLREDLIKAGVKEDVKWNESRILIENKAHPIVRLRGEHYDGRNVYHAWLCVDCSVGDGFGLFSHDCTDIVKEYEELDLTPETYDSVLKTIVDRYANTLKPQQ